MGRRSRPRRRWCSWGINRDRDVIFVDQRGTLHADPLLSCPEIDQFVDEATGLSILAASTAQRDLDAVRACRTRLASAGYDLSAYNTTENAADIADLRTARKRYREVPADDRDQ